MSEKTFEGATVEAALEAAAAKIGAAVSELEHEVVEKKEDFWGIGDSTVVIKAWRRAQPVAEVDEIDAPEQYESAPAEEQPPTEAAEEITAGATVASPEARPNSAGGAVDAEVSASSAPAASEPTASDAGPPETEAVVPETSVVAADAAAAAETPTGRPEGREHATARADSEAGSAEPVDPRDISAFLEQIFHDMEFECTLEVEPEEDGFLATIDGADKDAILEGNGRCLSALELLANNAFRHKLPRGSKVRVDAGDFRNKRDDELSDLAFQVAHSAKESGRTQETQPLNPYERRLVHLALAEDPAVTTRSRGSGFLKNVQVIPSAGGGDRSRRRR